MLLQRGIYDSELNGVLSIVTVGYRAIVRSRHYLVVFVQWIRSRAALYFLRS